MGEGVAPAIGLVDPKFPRLGARTGYRLPREERMRGYKDVMLRKDERFPDVSDFDEPDHMADAVGVTWGR